MESNKYLRLNRIMIGIFLLLLLLLPSVVKDSYYLHVFIMVFWTAGCALAWNIIGGFTGQFSLGHAVFIGMGAYASAIVQAKFEMNPFLGLILGVVVSVIVAVLFFYPCFSLRGPYFTMATLGMSLAVRNIFINWDFIGKSEGILFPFKGASSWKWFQFTSKIPYYYTALIIAVIFVFISIWVSRSKLGYALKAIRENENTAAAVGIDNAKYKLYAVVVSVALISISGSFYAHYIRFVDPDIMIIPRSIEVVLPVILGGMGTIIGPIVGTIIITPLTEIMRSTLGGHIAGSHYVVIAVIMIIMIEFKPSGISGWLLEHYYALVDKIIKKTKKEDKLEQPEEKKKTEVVK